MSMEEAQVPVIKVNEVLGKGEGIENISDTEKIICPTCHGLGYCQQIGQPEVFNVKMTDENTGQRGTFPSIKQPFQQPQAYQVEQLFNANANRYCKTLGRRPNSARPSVRSHKKPVRKSPGQVKISPNSTNSNNYPQLINLLPSPLKSDKHPEDAARLAALKLNRSEWELKKAGLEECLDLAHFDPEELEPYMSLVYRTMSSLLNNCRPPMSLFTCQAAREFFVRMASVCRPEFDELVFSLLNRTADNNRYIRFNANDTLDKMVTYIPTVHAVRPLVEKGPFHNNPLVRTATARLLTSVVASVTPNAILTHPTLRESCKRILASGAILLADSNLETRAAAKSLFQIFLNEDEFEDIYYAEVDEEIRKRIDRAFTELLCKKYAKS